MPPTRPSRRRVSLASLCVAALSVATASAVLVAAPQSASAATPTRAQVLAAAYAYGHSRGYTVGIAVLDTRTGLTYRAGNHAGTFASESVVKVMIATRVFLQGRLHGATARRMYTMITQSDDQIASSTYGSVGGDHLVTWIKKRFGLPGLGSEPRRAGWWGNTHITPDGMVALYGKLQKMRTFGPWLLNAMHHATKHGSDGFYQWFGLKSASSTAAIKQGWGTDYDNWGAGADENTTGFVNGDRYAVAILARGPARTYGGPIGAMLTATAKRLLPGGVFPSDVPVVTSVTSTTGAAGRITGGARLTIHGRNLGGASAVSFGAGHGASLHRVSAGTITVLVPAHRAGPVHVRVRTPLGLSSASGPRFTFVAKPTVTSVPAQAKAGSTLTIRGTSFVGSPLDVTFGSVKVHANVTSSTSLAVVVPTGLVGTVTLHVVTRFGTSAGSSFGYPPLPATSSAPTTSAPSTSAPSTSAATTTPPATVTTAPGAPAATPGG